MPRYIAFVFIVSSSLFFSPSSAEANEGANTELLQQQILDALVSGRDATALIEGFKQQLSGKGIATRPNQANETADFERALTDFRITAESNSAKGYLSAADISALGEKYDVLYAAHLLLQQRFQSIQARIEAAGSAAEIAMRGRRAQDDYAEVGDELFESLDETLGTLGRTTDRQSLLDDQDFRKEAFEALRNVLNVLKSVSKPVSRPILRNSLLPFRNIALPQRAPKLTPTIQPSYQNPIDTPVVQADLSAAVGVPLSDEIISKARELDHDYIRIYEFVRNHVKTQWYSGAMKGAVGTLRQGSGNDVDQASLLIALFRASGLPSRYVHGVIELPVEVVAESLALTDASAVPVALSRAGVAFTPVVRGGRIAMVQVEHTWVSTQVPYANYRGAMVDASGKTWLPLVPALKRYNVVPSDSLFVKSGLTAEGVVRSYLLRPQEFEPLESVRKAINDYRNTQGDEATYESHFGSTNILAEEIGLLPNTLPITVVSVTGEEAELADSYRQKVRFVARQGTSDTAPVVLDYTVDVSEVASERVTLSYIPATVDDQKTTDLFGGLDYVPAYLIKLRPQIKINGRQHAVARESLAAGSTNSFEIELSGPFGSTKISQTITAGDYHAIGLYAQAVSRVIPEDDPADSEYTAAKLLDRIAWRYSQRWTEGENELSGLLDVAIVRPLPSVAVVSNAIEVESVFGQPQQISWQGVTLDAALRVAEPLPRNDNPDSAVDWMRLAALQGSALEHKIFEDEFAAGGISADKGLGLAPSAGIEILEVTKDNVATLLPTLSHPAEVVADIENWIRLGMKVEVPRETVSHEAWSGSVWRVEDPESGAGGYFISGGLAGGSTSTGANEWIMDWVRDALMAANTSDANNDPQAAASIDKIYATDWQKGDAGQELPAKIAVLVRDRYGNPVQGALVSFAVIHGGGMLNGESQVTVETNAIGIAQATLKLGERIEDNPVYVMRNSGDRYVTKAGWNQVEVWVARENGKLSISEPFSAIGYPGTPVRMIRTNEGSALGPPSVQADLLTIQAQDEFGNSVSNVNISFTVGRAFPGCASLPNSFQNAVLYDASVSTAECPRNPVLGECGQSGVSLTTHLNGASAGVILGNAVSTRYSVNVTGVGSALDFSWNSTGRCERYGLDTVWLSSGVMGSRDVNDKGNVISAAKAGSLFQGAVRASTFYQYPLSASAELCSGSGCDIGVHDYHCKITVSPVSEVRKTTANVSFSVSNGGMPTSPNGVYLGNGTYETHVVTGANPGSNVVHVKAERVAMKGVRAVPPDCTIEEEVPISPDSSGIAQGDISEVYGLLPAVYQLTTSGTPSDRIMLTEGNQSQFEATLNYRTEPNVYQSLGTDVDILEEGTRIITLPGSTRSGEGVVHLPRGLKFDPGMIYEAQLVHNRGSQSEVKSDLYPIDISQKLFTNVTRSLHASMDVDVLNGTSCNVGGSFEFTLNDPARVTLVFTPKEGYGGVETTILDNESLEQGVHSYQFLPADNLPPGTYDIELRGVSGRDGHEEIETGSALSEYITENRLPVGHTIVKGVDVFDGSLTVGTSDFSLPGRGKSLEFRRTYGSNASAMPGRMGRGWAHNYESKIRLTRCGDPIVIGGEGGGARYISDGNGGFKPTKGYHGTLIANQTDRTFDFYSKDGTRYHYRNLGSGLDWNLEFIEDTNGNITKLGYDPSSPAIAKLITVEDSAGRKLHFNYENRTFAGFPKALPVVSRIEGPDGIVMTFDYDEYGDLIRASSGNDSRVENYAYSTDTSVLPSLQHKLVSYSDPNGHLTHYTYNENTVVIEGNGTTVPTLYLPQSIVETVTGAEGDVTRFSYDFGARKTTVNNARHFDSTYTMDAYGSVVQIDDPAGTTTMTWADSDVVMTSKTNARNVRTDFTYDGDGNLLTETVGGYTTTYTYQPYTGRPIKNLVASKTNRNGHPTLYSYDGKGNLVRIVDAAGGITEHTYNNYGDRVRSKDPNGNITWFTYNAYGNLESVTDHLGGTTTTAWNERSLPVERTDARGNKTVMEYDILGQLTRRIDPLGSEHLFSYDPAGNKLTETDEEQRSTAWTYDSENRVTAITDAVGKVKHISYDANGNKASESDWQNNTTTFEYDGADRLVKRSEPLGRITQIGYDGVGNVTAETDPRNFVTTYDYDDLNRRTRIIDALQGEHTFAYDGEGNKISEVDPLHRTTSYEYDTLNRLVTVNEPLGRVTRYEYDANGNRTAEIDPLERTRRSQYDALNRLVMRTDAEGANTLFEYDRVGNLSRQINARLFAVNYEYDELNRRTRMEQEVGSNELAGVSKSTVTTTYEYDKVGNKVKEVLPNGNEVLHTYDALNRLKTSSDVIGQIVAYEYDANGNRIRETDANGNVSVKTYDALNRLVQADMPEGRTIKVGYDANNNKKSETDARNYTTTYDYDALNRLTTVTDPLGYTVSYTYDALGNKRTETDKNHNATTFDYDELNRLTTVTDPLAQAVTFEYDLAGNKVAESDKRQTLTTYSYDKENRPTRTVKDGLTLLTVEYDELGRKKFETDALGNVTTWIYDHGRDLVLLESRPLAAITHYTYDEMGDKIAERDPEGRVNKWGYDKRRRLLSETNGAGETTTHNYDGNGNRTLTAKPLGNTWYYDYDGADRLVSITDSLGNTTGYSYDGNGNRLTQTDANHQTTTYEYDALNRRTAAVYADAAREEYGYDANGNRTSLLDAKGQSFSYVYDALNRESGRHYPLPASPRGDELLSVATAYDPNGNPQTITATTATAEQLTRRAYDRFDRLIEVTDGHGKTLKYQYDANGNRTVLSDPDGKVTRYSYDALNRVSTVTNAGGTSEYRYDRSSLLSETRHPNGSRAVQSYDGAGRIRHIDNLQGTAVVTSYDYQLDANGNRSRQVEVSGGAEETTTYGYDLADRLQSVAYPDKTTTYTYDGAYNRLTERSTDGSGTVLEDRRYDYDNRNRLRSITDNLDAARSIGYSYDANGNQTLKSKNGSITTFVYDARDKLVSVQQDSTTLGLFRYDYAGRRIEKDLGGQIVRTSYDGDSALIQYDSNGDTLARYDYGPQRLASLEQVAEGRQYYLFDGLGSVSALTNAAGTLQARYQYDAWGNERQSAGSSFNRFGYTGHEKDEETGLYYFKARYYDPDTARFINQDSYLGESETPPSLHRYLYAYANPTVYTDPSGHFVCGGLCIAGGVLIAGAIADYFYDMDDARENLNAAIDSTEPSSTGTMVLATAAKTTVTVATGVLGFLPDTGEQIGEFAANDNRTLADTPILGPVGTNLGQSTAAFAEEPSFDNGVQAFGAVSGAFLTTVAPLTPKRMGAASGEAQVVEEAAGSPGASLLQSEIQSLQKIKNNAAKQQGLNERINQRGIVYDIKQTAREAVRQTDIEGVSAKNGVRGTRAHAILEENVPKVHERYRGTGYGAQAEQFRLPSPDGIKPGAPARRRQRNSRGLDVVVTKEAAPVKGLDLKTGNAKFSDTFKQDLRVRFKLDDIEEINIK